MRKPDSRAARAFPLRFTLAKGFTVLMTCVLGTQAAAQPVTSAPATPASSAPDQRYTLEQLGARYPLNLRGVDGSNSVAFGVRNDRVVTDAQLNLRYTYSPALLPDISHINVLLNDEVAASLSLPKETGGLNLQRKIDIPPYLITGHNSLRLQLIGHYTMGCEDPVHSSLWANISNTSTLDLATQPLQTPNDLANLPEPFFDRRENRRLELPFVFASTPDGGVLEAAGAVSSWFGALAGSRGAHFTASVGAVPAQGHAVVFAVGAQPALAPAPVQGPTLAVVANPNDPNGKLLLVMGQDAKELKQAATALVVGSQALAGPVALVTQAASLQPRQPYDAPKWLRTDRPVSFGELIEAQRLNVSGYSPATIGIDVRVPPDLFGWRADKVPIDLHYRYTPQPTSVNSALLFSVDDQFVKTMPLLALERIEGGDKLAAQVLPDESLPMRAQLDVPLELLKSRAQLQFRYMYDYLKQGECRDIIIDNVRGVIEPESTIDISGYPHFIAMPDLAAFAQAGFPFTRMADLSETAVLLGANAGVQEYSAYLTTMGRMGESTGYPSIGVTVLRATPAATAPAGKDLLVIASGADQSWLASWAERMPAAYERTSRFAMSDLVYRVQGWFQADPRHYEAPRRAAIAYTGTGVSAVVAGFESSESQRSVVLIASNQPDGLRDATLALLDSNDSDRSIQGSLAVIRGKQVDSVVGEHQYYVGSIGLFKRLDWWLSSVFPSLTLTGVAVMLLILAALSALAVGLLRRRKPKPPTA